MEGDRIDQYMEKTNEDYGIMKTIEVVKEDYLMEQVQHPFTKDYEHENNEVEFPLCEENNYPSLCVIGDTDHLENENVKY